MELAQQATYMTATGRAEVIRSALRMISDAQDIAEGLTLVIAGYAGAYELLFLDECDRPVAGISSATYGDYPSAVAELRRMRERLNECDPDLLAALLTHADQYAVAEIPA